MDFLEFSVCKIMSFVNKAVLHLLFQSGCLLCLCCLITQARISRTLLNSSEYVMLALFPALGGEEFDFSPLNIMLAAAFSRILFIMLRK